MSVRVLAWLFVAVACGAPAERPHPATEGGETSDRRSTTNGACILPAACGGRAPDDVGAPPADATREASGLVTRVLHAGTGTERPGPRDTVTVRYAGWTADGTPLDSSEGRTVVLRLSYVIAGWTEGVGLMVAGEARRLWIPEALAYRGRPPEGTLVFDIELVSFTPAPPEPPPPDRPDPGTLYTLPIPPTAPVRGAAAAPVVVHAFLDFQSIYDARVQATLADLLREYDGRIRLVFRHFPLDFHSLARPAAEAALEVLEQRGLDAFWSFHDALFLARGRIDRDAILRLAAGVPGLDLAALETALDAHEHADVIDADVAALLALGLETVGTPTFFVDGRLLQGAQPIETFRAAIDDALAAHAAP